MDVIIYTRVSTEDQKENGFSLQDQERRIKKYCDEQDYDIIAHYQDDSSAKDFNRPQFQKMLTDLREKRIKPSQLICLRMDRFSRSLEGTQVSFKVIQESLEHLQASLSDLESIEGAVRTARKSLEKIDSARISIKGTIENQSQRLSGLIGSSVESGVLSE